MIVTHGYLIYQEIIILINGIILTYTNIAIRISHTHFTTIHILHYVDMLHNYELTDRYMWGCATLIS